MLIPTPYGTGYGVRSTVLHPVPLSCSFIVLALAGLLASPCYALRIPRIRPSVQAALAKPRCHPIMKTLLTPPLSSLPASASYWHTPQRLQPPGLNVRLGMQIRFHAHNPFNHSIRDHCSPRQKNKPFPMRYEVMPCLPFQDNVVNITDVPKVVPISPRVRSMSTRGGK